MYELSEIENPIEKSTLIARLKEIVENNNTKHNFNVFWVVHLFVAGILSITVIFLLSFSSIFFSLTVFMFTSIILEYIKKKSKLKEVKKRADHIYSEGFTKFLKEESKSLFFDFSVIDKFNNQFKNEQDKELVENLPTLNPNPSNLCKEMIKIRINKLNFEELKNDYKEIERIAKKIQVESIYKQTMEIVDNKIRELESKDINLKNKKKKLIIKNI